MRFIVHKDDGDGTCVGCGESWPCPAVRHTVDVAEIVTGDEL